MVAVCLALQAQGVDAMTHTTAGFKTERDTARHAGAGSSGDRAAWNTLFMRPDTVAAAVAAHYGVSRSELLDREASGVLSTVRSIGVNVARCCHA